MRAPRSHCLVPAPDAGVPLCCQPGMINEDLPLLKAVFGALFRASVELSGETRTQVNNQLFGHHWGSMKKTSNWTEEQSFCFMIIILGVNSNRGILPVLFCLSFCLSFFFRGEGKGSSTALKLGRMCKRNRDKNWSQSFKSVEGRKTHRIDFLVVALCLQKTPFCSANVREWGLRILWGGGFLMQGTS